MTLTVPSPSQTITVSSGLGTVVIRDVAGQPEKQALRTLRKQGLKPKVVRRSSSTVKAGLAIGTEPGVGRELGRGEPQLVALGLGPLRPRTLHVPALRPAVLARELVVDEEGAARLARTGAEIVGGDDPRHRRLDERDLERGEIPVTLGLHHLGRVGHAGRPGQLALDGARRGGPQGLDDRGRSGDRGTCEQTPSVETAS